MLKNTANLLNLQNLMKRDPQSYLEEFRQQQRHFMANLQIFQSSILASSAPTSGATSTASPLSSQQTGSSGSKQPKFNKDFGGLVTFLAHVSPCFRAESEKYSSQLLELLTQHYEILDPPLRKTIVQAVILLQNRGLLERMTLLPILFQLFKIQDKPLRLLLFSHIISDIKRINLKRTPGYLKVNSQLQNYMYTMLSDKASPLAAKKSLDVMIDLWRRKIWNDEKTVHAIQNASFSKDTKIKVEVTALRFFLGMTFYDEEEEEEEEEEKQTIRAKLSVSKGSLKGVVKKRKKAERVMKRAQKKMNKEDGKGNKGSSVVDDCPAIFLLHDPQSYAERLFTMVKNSNESFQVRMLIMNVISRLIGAHRLVLLNFYPFLQKYMQPHQKNVTHILTYLAQASHPLVPPDVLQPCIKTLANHFVNDRSSAEVTAVGLNAIREICARAPLVMDSELLWDLVAYKKDKNKGVMMASRSIIALFRDINPTLLKRKERGRDAAEFVADEVEYGFQKVRTDIVGAELLQQINQEAQAEAEEAAGGAGKKLGKDGKEKRGGYRALLGDEWDLEMNDSDDEEEEEEDEDLGTSTREVNAFLRTVQQDSDADEEDPATDRKKSTSSSKKKKLSGKKLASAKQSLKARAKAGTLDQDEDEDGDEMMLEDGEDDDDEEEGEDGEEESGEEGEDADEMEISGDEGEDAESESEDEDGEDSEEEDEAPSKKRKTNGGKAVAAAKKPTGEDDQKDPADAGKPALPFGATRIFTPRDFEDLKRARLSSHMQNGKKRSRNGREDGTTLLTDHYDVEEGEDEDGSLVKRRERRDITGTTVDEKAIVGFRKVLRKDKKERLATILASRSDGINSKKKGGGSTNQDKAREKPFLLTKHSSEVRAKKQRSFSQQQKSFSGHIQTMKRSGKKIKNKMKKRKSHKATV